MKILNFFTIFLLFFHSEWGQIWLDLLLKRRSILIFRTLFDIADIIFQVDIKSTILIKSGNLRKLPSLNSPLACILFKIHVIKKINICFPLKFWWFLRNVPLLIYFINLELNSARIKSLNYNICLTIVVIYKLHSF